MKKINKLLSVLILSISVHAASIDYLMNNSAGYLGNPSQTGNISVDGAFYNPAGLTHLEDGTYINISGLFSRVEESMEVSGKKFKAKDYPMAPSFNLVYKKDKSAFYLNGSVIGGGPNLKFKDGVAGIELAAQAFNKLDPFANTGRALNAKLENGNFEGENRYYQGIIGATYQLNETVSLSLGGKYVYSVRKLEGDAEYSFNGNSLIGSTIQGHKLHIKSKREADGFGGVLGLNIKATDNLNIAFKYDTPVRLKFDSKTTENERITIGAIGKTLGISDFYPSYKDGLRSRRDLPGVLSVGISNKVNKFTFLAGFSHYFNEAANIDQVDYEDGNEVNFGIMYDINEKFTWTAGVNISDTGAKTSSYNDVEFALNSQFYGTGLIYKPDNKNEFTFTISYINYNSKNGEDENFVAGTKLEKSDVTYKKSIFGMGLGYTYKF